MTTRLDALKGLRGVTHRAMSYRKRKDGSNEWANCVDVPESDYHWLVETADAVLTFLEVSDQPGVCAYCGGRTENGGFLHDEGCPYGWMAAMIEPLKDGIESALGREARQGAN